jgi:hypothetical protein
MVIEDLKSALTEIQTLKNSEVYDLRIASSYADHALNKLEDPVRFRQALRDSLYYIRVILRRYMPHDPNLRRLDDVLSEWWFNLRPGPRRFGTNPLDNPDDNPIRLPDGDDLPGAMVYQYAIQHKYSRDFAEEMTDILIRENWKASTQEEVHFLLSHLAWKVKRLGTVFHGTQKQVDPVRHFFRRQEIAYDKYPRDKFVDPDDFIIWVPLYQRLEAIQLLKDSRLTP